MNRRRKKTKTFIRSSDSWMAVENLLNASFFFVFVDPSIHFHARLMVYIYGSNANCLPNKIGRKNHGAFNRTFAYCRFGLLKSYAKLWNQNDWKRIKMPTFQLSSCEAKKVDKGWVKDGTKEMAERSFKKL